ncbi:MAG: patatin-like phospholipase family protein, partial [Candidatus Atribacteria bacterium]|nr:patatin-like phospholipase family protein [Candidatus Atribacteria bacterium]
MNRILIYLILVIFFIVNHSITFGQAVRTDTLSLEFDQVHLPPFCFTPHKIIKRPRVGLALSGGGARGFAQIGVLQVLEENNIPIDIIVGSSMGSIIGGLYAAGYSPKEIEQITKNIDWSTIMVDKPPRTSLFIGQKQERGRAILQFRFKGLKPAIPQAITPGQKLTSILTNLTLTANYPTSSDFDQLKIPFRALACDLVSGNSVIIGKGNLAEAMKASSAVPLLFAPVAIDSMLLVDAGLINNIPVDEVQDFDVDLVIGVDTVSKLRDKENLRAPWEVADQVTTIMQREKNAIQRTKADILIQIDLDDYKSDSFEQASQIIEAGKNEALKYISQIKARLAPTIENNFSIETYQVKSINIQSQNIFSKEIAQNIIHSKIHGYTSYRDVSLTLKNIYETGYFDDVKAFVQLEDSLLSISFQIVTKPKFTTLVFIGNSVFSDSVLDEQIKSEPGKSINFDKSRNDILRIVKLYKENGYALININQIRLNNDTLNIEINEGTISSIKIEGNERTKNYVILREFPLKRGDIFNINKADEGLNNIHSTGLFETVSFEVLKDKSQVKLNIKVKEKAFSLLRLGYRFDLERRNKGMIELADENFWGVGNQVSLTGQYGLKDQAIQLKFRDDRIFKSYMTYHLDLFYHHQKNYTYQDGIQIGEYLQKESGFSFSLGQQIERLGIISVIATLNSVDLQDVTGYGYSTGKFEFKTIALQSIVDSQDQFPFPKAGKYYQFFYKMSSAKFLNSQESFIKLFNSFEIYQTFMKRNTIHPRLFWGTSDLTTPFIEQFRIGGQSSFYGLRENEKIGRHVIVGSLEYRYLFPFGLPRKLYWSMRYDLGSTWKNQLDIQLKDFIHGFGTSLALETPVGPITFAFGRSSIGKNVFYFSGGFSF